MKKWQFIKKVWRNIENKPELIKIKLVAIFYSGGGKQIWIWVYS